MKAVPPLAGPQRLLTNSSDPEQTWPPWSHQWELRPAGKQSVRNRRRVEAKRSLSRHLCGQEGRDGGQLRFGRQ